MYREHKHGLHAICKTWESGHYETRSYPHGVTNGMQAQKSTQLSQVKQLYTEMRYWKVGTCQIKGTKQAAWQISSIYLLIGRATDLSRPWFDSNFIISSFFSFSLILNELLLQTRSLYILGITGEAGSRNCWWFSVFRWESLSANWQGHGGERSRRGDRTQACTAAAYDVTAQYGNMRSDRIRVGKNTRAISSRNT